MQKWSIPDFRSKPVIGLSFGFNPKYSELNDYRLRKRKEYEDLIRRVRWNVSVWVKYAQWEESQKDFGRARSVWERALEVDYRNHTLWLKYAEMEMKKKFINHAQNVWDGAKSLLPRIDQLWYKYIHMEEVLGNVAGARQIFESTSRWKAYIKYAKFEMKNGEIARSRSIYETAVEKLADDEDAEMLFVAFAEFEERCKETEQARCIYKFALDHIPKGRAEDLYRRFVQFEKQYGDREGRGCHKESVGIKERVRQVYERINHALYEEVDAEDVERTREVYRECLKLIPHKKFTFSKIWLLAAQFEIRQLNQKGARQILGNAIGMAPKDKTFKRYIEIELQLGNVDRCRTLYERYLEWSPENCYAWSKYAELEISLCETERARKIFELAVEQPSLDMPELLWKAYIDFEISEGEFENTRELYVKLLSRTKHLKVWISYAKFEASAIQEVSDEGMSQEQLELYQLDQRRRCIERARSVFESAVNYYRKSSPELKEERAMLLEEWLEVERSFGELGDVSSVQRKLPKKLKKKRPLETEDGPAGFEEYID
ncbi:hypothetical protein MLD38_011191 [Melastoma candidum]|uniref:Uncharacterized protein n=1 Tax=Melastoma candidum TaxID=119954 RepID=A0ACB9R1Q7_9MYRT|nr:hypothetical protein MLD38_011191 [Melastoma candidum]